LEPVEVSLLTSRRGAQRPYGLAGGQPGCAGVNIRIARDGGRSVLPEACHVVLEAGEAIEIQTPGGGGFSQPE
jgi:5-oxoprolinase (ATP-hydrolysing)